MKLFNNKTNELRRVFRKFSMVINSLERVNYGPYGIKEVPKFDQCKEVDIRYELRHLMGLFYKEKLATAVETWNIKKPLLNTKEKTFIEENNDDQKLITAKIIDQAPGI